MFEALDWTAVLVYVVIGLAVGALSRFTRSEALGLSGALGAGGAGGLIGGVALNAVTGDDIVLDTPGLIGSVIGAIVITLVVWTARRRQAGGTSSKESSPS